MFVVLWCVGLCCVVFGCVLSVEVSATRPEESYRVCVRACVRVCV